MTARDDVRELGLVFAPPLCDCIRHCETECVAGCCGLDAFSFAPDHVAAWARSVGPAKVAEALYQLQSVSLLVEDRSFTLRSVLLNHHVGGEIGREELRRMLVALREGLQAPA